MIKYSLIIINSLAVFFYGLFSDGVSPTVTGVFPPTMKAGQETMIELHVNKGAMNGFAKLQMELPDGLAPKETENKGANYTYTGGVAKWVWASLPPESEIVIKIKLISSDETSGLKTITAKFSFVENNAKQVVDMTPGEITVIAAEGNTDVATGAPPASENTIAVTPAAEPTIAVNPPAVITETIAAPVTQPESTQPVATSAPTSAVTTTPVATETIASVPVIVETGKAPSAVITQPEKPANPPVTQASANSNAEPPGNIQVIRTLTQNNDGGYLVKVKIKKGATKGFARYSDDLPEGLTIKAIKTEGSSFSVGDGKLKFVWVNVPAKEEMNLEYLIIGGSASPVVMNGEYSYLEDNQSKKYIVNSETVSISGGIVATTGSDTKAGSAEAGMNGTLTKKEGDINYHVQIGAFTSSKVDAERLKKVFHVNEAINSELQGGFSKFMVGSHGEYKEARDHREVVKTDNGIKSAFVVAYNGSKRITVQEALMIANQKWFK